MTFATHISTDTQVGLGARFLALVADLRDRMTRRKVFKNTFNELSSLSDRGLADLGLNRSNLRRVAYQAAYEG